ncbi:hypothetical protein E3N88_17731 [Mikania micrantha]|uniref:Lipocalin/cytosolic fatty-acid binding domain-containing protein n=1 Tax=Mikania micrantha TaxID=192012 RepID=A0A5N6NUX2_9ASTR|nr:hypothetical protein E3N88_17731 [Mikania micrantha]
MINHNVLTFNMCESVTFTKTLQFHHPPNLSSIHKHKRIPNPQIMAKKSTEVVKNIDIARNMGRWYEIASITSRFQPKNGINTATTYTYGDDGTVNVLNETWSDGKRGFIEGTAYKADPNSDEAKLKVKFYVPPILPIIPVVGDYWVLYVDDDYQYCLIGQSSRNDLWILSRQTHLDEEIYNMLVDKAKDEGYDVAKLRKTTHTNGPEMEDAPVDTKGVWWFKSMLGL